MSNNRSKSSTFILSSIIAFLLSIFLTMASYLGGVYFGIFNKTMIIDSINNATYYSSINETTLTSIKPLAIPMGLDESIFENIFTTEETSTECKNFLTAKLNNEDYTINTSAMEKRLTDNISNYLLKKGYTADAEQQSNIDSFAKLVAEDYKSNIEIPYISYFNQIRTLINKIVLIGIPILLVLSALAVILLLKLHKWWHRGLRFVTYSTLAAGIMTAGVPAFFLITAPYKKLNITPDYFKSFIVNYINKGLASFIYVSLLMFAISIALICVIIYRKNTLKHQSHHHHHHDE